MCFTSVNTLSVVILFVSYISYILDTSHSLYNYSLVIHELGLLILADKGINSKIRLLKNLIGGSAYATLLLSLAYTCMSFHIRPSTLLHFLFLNALLITVRIIQLTD
ncbi:hypothetical protein FWK35_00030504 [Aphis craccivora]|uniref:Uncharacterized protein n=1 Tax=Aphis craccivora TaxID=307492 RepID=A0A6G0YTC6_APHCR|nr:hypothetical protein FWK35_00030504 [Aphis craccivora]